MGHSVGRIASFILPAIATYFGGPVAGALASGGTTLARGGSFGQALLGAGGSYFGNAIGNNLFGGSTIGSTIGNAANSLGAGSALSGALGGAFNAAPGGILSNILSTPIGGAFGSFAGNNLADSLSGFTTDQAMQGGRARQPAGFSPSRNAELDAPASLSGFSGLNPDQRESNLANQGVYGGGLGPDEQQYFLNLVNRRLVDDSGHVNEQSSLPQIDNSYLQQLGLGGYGNSNDLLQAISQWHH